MERLRSKSVDLTSQCLTVWSKTILCGTNSVPLSSTFYSKASDDISIDDDHDEDTNESVTSESVGTIQKFCDTLKRPFKKRSLSIRSARQLLLRRSNDQAEAPLPVLFTATAIRDNVPHPYDSNGLPFTRGDKIHVTRVTDYGVWTGRCGERIGNFKFVDVEKDDLKVRSDKSQSYPELQSVCQRSKSVSDLLSSINQENLIPKFILNGFDTTESIKAMNDEDLEYLGIVDDKTKDLIMGTIDWLNLCGTKPSNQDDCPRISDSGYNSSSESFTSHQRHSFKVENSSFLHPITALSQSVNNLLIVTPL